MRRTPVIAVVVASTLMVACVGKERAPDPTTGASSAGTAGATTVASPTTDATGVATTGAGTTGTTGTGATDTSVRTTVTAGGPTSTLVWQRFPLSPVKPWPKPSTVSPLISRVNTTDPVVFITIDDGIVRDPRVLSLLIQHQATATLFLNSGPLHQAADYFAGFAWIGGSINSHTITHPHLKGMSFDAQKGEICGVVSQLKHLYGSAGDLFRPPFGEWDGTTLKAAAACGERAVVLWKETMAAGHIATQGGQPIKPGDIILLHFRTDLYDNLVALFAQLDLQGLKVARLEDYLPPR